MCSVRKGLNLQRRHRRRTIPLTHAQDVDGSGAAAGRRAGSRLRALPRRRQQPRVPRLLRATGGAGDERGLLDERAARLHEHALQAARGLPAEGRRGRLGHAPGPPRGRLGGLQVGAPPDAGPAARAVPALPADRRGLRLPEPRVRGLGGRRRDRHARDAGRRGGDQDDRRLDRPRRVPARHGERRADDDPARRLRRQRLHARPRRGALRDPARPGAGLHRAQGRHLGQHPGRSGDRRQDRGAADLAVRVARGGDRARRGAVARAQEEHHRARRPGAAVEGAGDDAPRPRAELRRDAARPRGAGPLAAEGDLPQVRVPEPPAPGRRARRRGPGGADAAREDGGSLERGT